MPKITLCMIVKDEAENLPRCLDSVAGVVDEVVIVDTGSSDRTPEIARARGARVETLPWPGSFNLARNRSLDLASGDWVLVMDADEELDRRDRARLRKLVEAGGESPPPEGYLLRVINHLGTVPASPVETHASVRLFRNRAEHRYEGLVHEQPRVPRPALTDIRIHHWGYVPETYADRRKAERNERLLTEALAAKPDDPYLLYSLAVLYYATRRYPEARETIVRAVALIEPSRHYHSRALKVLAMAEEKTAGPRAAITALDRAVSLYPDYTDLYYLRAGFRREAGDLAGAIADACECLARGEAPTRYDSHCGTGGLLALDLLVELLAAARDGRGRLAVFRALGRAAGRATVSGDAAFAERVYQVGLDEVRRHRGRLRGMVARAAADFAVSYARYLSTRAILELEQAIKACPWCETLARTWRQTYALGIAPPVAPAAAPEGAQPAGVAPVPEAVPRSRPTAPPDVAPPGAAPPGAAATPSPAEPAPAGERGVSPTITVCLIARDEAAHLPRCLASVAAHVDEIVVVDTGSTDRTADLARTFGAVVLDFPWTGDFSQARNFALEHATSEWVLELDADEEVAPGDGPRLKATIRAHPWAEGFLVRVVDYLGGRPGVDRAANTSFRLFRNRPEHRYVRAVHEQVTPVTFERDGKPAVVPCSLVIYHYGYLDPVDRAKRRGERNLRLAEKELAERPGDPFCHFNLAAEHLKAGRYTDALRHYQEAIERADQKLAYAAEARIRAAITLALLGAGTDALAELAEAEKLYPNFTDVFFLRGEVLRSLGRPIEAREAFSRCLELGETPPGYPTLLGVGTFRAAAHLGEIYEDLGSPRAALACYAQALAFEPRFLPAYLGRARSLLALYGDGARDRFEKELAPDDGTGAKVNLTIGYVWLVLFRPRWALPYLARALGEAGEADLDPTSRSKAEALAGLAYFALGRDEEAVQHLSAAGPDESGAALALALLCASRVDEAKALHPPGRPGLKPALLREVVARFEDDPTGTREEPAGPPRAPTPQLAALYRDTPQSYVETALELVSLGAARRHPGLLKACLELMRPVEDLGPWLRLGKFYSQAGLDTMAAVELVDCLNRGVADAEAAAIVGGYLVDRGRFGEGETFLRKAVEWDPACWRARLGVWTSLRKRAAAAAVEAAELFPRSAAAAGVAEEVQRCVRRPAPPNDGTT